MDSHLKISNILSPLTSTKRVKSVGHRQNDHQQNLFKDTFQAKQKKKKGDKNTGSGENSRLLRTAGKAKNTRKINTRENEVETSSNLTIDITV